MYTNRHSPGWKVLLMFGFFSSIAPLTSSSPLISITTTTTTTTTTATTTSKTSLDSNSMKYCSRLCQSLDKCETTLLRHGRDRHVVDDVCGGEVPEWCSNVRGCDQYFIRVIPPPQQQQQQEQEQKEEHRQNDPKPTTKVNVTNNQILHIEDDYDEKVQKKSCASICDEHWYCLRRDPWGGQYCGTIPLSCRNEPKCKSMDSDYDSHGYTQKYTESKWEEEEKEEENDDDDDSVEVKGASIDKHQNHEQEQRRMKGLQNGVQSGGRSGRTLE